MSSTTLFLKRLYKPIGLATFPKNMLLRPMVLQHFPQNVAQTIGFTTFPQQHLLKHFTVVISQINVAKTNVSSNMILGNVVEPLSLATFCSETLRNPNGFSNMF